MSNPLGIKSKQCRICGASALHSNYGVETCNPCKVFFRRNVEASKDHFPCPFDNNCQINAHNRRICSSCRLKKCLASGMQIELIRPSRSTVKHRKTSSTSTEFAFNSNQSTLFSQLLEYYNEQKCLTITQQWANQSEDLTLRNEFFEQIYQISGEYLQSNRDLLSLPFDDRSAFLRNIAENITCFGMALIWQFSRLDRYEPFTNLIDDICKFMDSDLIMAKLTLSLFAFSIHTAIFSSPITDGPLNTWSIVQIQNTYAELAWKYLLQKYGYPQVIQRFLRMIQCLLAATIAVSNAQNVEKHVYNIQALVEQTEIFFIVDDVEKIQ